jgi:hypothetical protein
MQMRDDVRPRFHEEANRCDPAGTCGDWPRTFLGGPIRTTGEHAFDPKQLGPLFLGKLTHFALALSVNVSPEYLILLAKGGEPCDSSSFAPLSAFWFPILLLQGERYRSTNAGDLKKTETYFTA